MRIPLVAAAALLITSAGAASAQTLTFQDLPDWNYAYNYNAPTTVTTGGFNITAAAYNYNYSYYYYNYNGSFLYTYDQSNSQYYGVTAPGKLMYSVTSDLTLTKADNGRFSFQGAQLGTWDYNISSPTSNFTIEGIRNGVVVDQALVGLNSSGYNYQATNFTAAWDNLDSVVIKPLTSYAQDYYAQNYGNYYQYTGTNGQPANYIWLANVQVNSATPEASTWILMGLGCIGMMAFARRRQLAFDV